MSITLALFAAYVCVCVCEQNVPAEPLKPQIYSRLQSHGAMYSLLKTQGQKDREKGGDRERERERDINFMTN